MMFTLTLALSHQGRGDFCFLNCDCYDPGLGPGHALDDGQDGL